MRLKNQIYTGANNKKALFDLTIPEQFNGKLLLFLHGYKGYKDWGCWNLMEDFFLKKHYGFCKFNFSHNGGTVQNGIDFPDLNAFANNRYSYELTDTLKMIDILHQTVKVKIDDFILVGHSRGGGIATLASTEKRVNKLITLASVSDLESRFPKNEKFEDWKNSGTYFVNNARTKQRMTHNFSFYTDFIENRKRLDISSVTKHISVPCLHIHGDKDSSVLPFESERLANLTNGTYLEIKNTQHTFDAKHPWEVQELPPKMKEMCTLMDIWIKKQAQH